MGLRRKIATCFFPPVKRNSGIMWQPSMPNDLPNADSSYVRFVRKVQFNRLINYLIKIMRKLAAETLIECQTSNQSHTRAHTHIQHTFGYNFRHRNRFAFHFYFIWLDLDKSQHILLHLVLALIFLFILSPSIRRRRSGISLVCLVSAAEYSFAPYLAYLARRLPFGMSSDSRPQAIEFNANVFVTDGGGGLHDTSTMLVWHSEFETLTSHCYIVIVTNDTYIFFTVRRTQ